MKPQTCSNLISSFWKKQDKRNKIRNRKGAFLKCGLKKKLVESSPVKQFTLCSCLLFKQLNHPCRGGIKKSLETAFLFTLFFLPSSSLISPVLHPSPKIGLTHFSHFCRAHATSTVLSSLFSPAASLFGSLYMDPTLCTAWRRVTHPCRIPWVQYQTACFPQKDKLRLVMGGPAIFLNFCFY